ncbi:hypothetical protein ACB092_11G221100 [Castanea dentata]
MAETMVVEAALSAIFHAVFERIASSGVVNYFMEKKLNDESLQKLKMFLLSANAVLVDAEEKQITNPAVKEWLDKLNGAVHDAEDLLDEIVYEDLQYNLRAKSQTGTSKVWNSITAFISFDEGIPSKLENVLAKLKIIIEQIGVLRLKEVASGVPLSSSRTTTSCQEKCDVLGRDMDKEAIFELWQSNDASSDEICVVPIKDMGGIGKTTFTRFIYNDSRVNERFDLKAWVCVLVNFDSFQTFKTILEEVRKTLAGKKVFLVLDDVWNENYNEWDEFLKVFKCGAQEVKIIVTTRSERVKSKLCTVPTHHCLKKLSNDRSWDLFVQHAFENGKCCADLEVIGKQIVKKCRGLPLAIKIVGGSLRSNENPTHWKQILKSHIWDLPEAKTNILPALRLSYHYLSSHLKSMKPEEIGDEYFNDLVSRSFFQQSNKSKSHFLMHDLINDLAKSISGEFCLRLENDEPNGVTKKIRHLSFYRANIDASKKFEIPFEAKGLRTFLGERCISELGELQHLSGKLSILNLENVHCINKDAMEVILKDKQDLSKLELKWEHGHGTEDSEKERNVLEQLCPHTKLNSLTIEHYEGTSFPNWLGDCSFSNMVSIVLRNCKCCFSLPPFGQLHALKELKIEGFELYGNDSSTIKPFKSLKYLSFKNMREWQEWIIFEDENLESLSASVGSHLDLTSLTYLKISTCPTFVSFLSGGICARKLTEMEVFSCKKLKSLPEGMVTLLPSLSSLQLYKCPELDSFPKDGLPSNLKALTIQYCEKLLSCRKEDFIIWSKCEELESFPKEALLPPTLTNFSISSFPNLKSLNGKGFQHLTSLQSLMIWSCYKLQCLPEQGLPTSLSVLQIFGYPLLNQQCEKETGKDWLKIAHIPYIEIDRHDQTTVSLLVVNNNCLHNCYQFHATANCWSFWIMHVSYLMCFQVTIKAHSLLSFLMDLLLPLSFFVMM